MAAFAGFVPEIFTPAIMYHAFRTEKMAQVDNSGILDKSTPQTVVGGRMLGDILTIPRKIRPPQLTRLDVTDLTVVDVPTRVNTGEQKFPIVHDHATMKYGESDLYRTGENFERSVIEGFVDRVAQHLLKTMGVVLNASLAGIATHNLDVGASSLTLNGIQEGQAKLTDQRRKLRTMIAHPNVVIDLMKEIRLAYVSNAVTGTQYLEGAELRALGIDKIIETDEAYVDSTSQRSAWVANTAYVLLDFVRPTTKNGFEYECTTAGTSHATTEPTWPVVIGDTVADGTAVWTCRAVPDKFASFLVGNDALCMAFQKETRIWNREVPDLANRQVWSSAYTDVVFGLKGTTYSGSALPSLADHGSSANWASSFDDPRDLLAVRLLSQAKGAGSDWIST